MIVVDGMNVVGSRPDGWWRDRRGAMASLVERLEALARSHSEGIIVIFDGRPFDLPADDAVDVRFASRRGPNAADDDIVALVAEADRPGELLVVTSDGDLAARVRSLGAGVVGAGELRRRLDDL